MSDVHRSEASVKSTTSTVSATSPQKSSTETKSAAYPCPAAEDTLSSALSPKESQGAASSCPPVERTPADSSQKAQPSNAATSCPPAERTPAPPPPPKKNRDLSWSMSLASAYAQILSALESGRDVLAMPPVGQLRLRCYRQMLKKLPGIVLIISSFQEHMEKEVDLLEKDGIPASMLHSRLTDYAMAAQLERIRRHHFQILFVSPGLLESPQMRAFLVSKTTISLIVIDEAQICSIHAPHFQPLYHAIPLLLRDLERHATDMQVQEELNMSYRDAASSGASIEESHAIASTDAVHIEASDRQKSPAPFRPPVLALTLPTTRLVEQDIRQFFSLRHLLLVRHEYERPNLFLSVHRPQRKAPFLLDFLRRHEDEAGIIYCTEPRLTEHIAQLLNRSGFPALSYHAGLTREERMANVRAFCAGTQSAGRQTTAQVAGKQRPDTRMANVRAFCAGAQSAGRQTTAQVAGSRHSNTRITDTRAFGGTQPARSFSATTKTEANAGARILVVTPDRFLELERSDVRFVLHYTMPESLDHYYQEVIHAGRDGLPAECILLANERDFELQRTKLGKATLGYQAHPEAVAQVKRQFEAMRRYAMTHQCLRAFMKDYVEGAGDAAGDYELVTLPARNRVLKSAELPVDESLRTIRQSGRYPENRVQKVSMQLQRAEKQHIFIRYADREHMRNRAYKYEHLRTDPWELCEPGVRVQHSRAFSIQRDACCVNCDPEHFLEEDRYGISDTLGLQERMREHLHQLETDMDVGRRIRLWKAGEKQYHFDYDAHARRTGRIMAMRKVEYQKNETAMATALGQSTEITIEVPAHSSPAPGPSSGVPACPSDDCLTDATAREDNASARTIDSEAETQRLQNEDRSAAQARTSESQLDEQQLRLLESARLEISPEMRTQLLGNLKALRKRLAMERSVQAYQIFTDKSLVEMCRMLPFTREEFARIHGVGPRKLELHYETFTAEIRKVLDPACVADFYENITEAIQEDLQDGNGACVAVGFAADSVCVAGFCGNITEVIQEDLQDGTGSCTAVGFGAVQARADGFAANERKNVVVDPEGSRRASRADAGGAATVIKLNPSERSESQQNPKYRFIPDDVLLAFLEEKYLQQRTRKQVKKKQDFFLTVAEAASFHCADGLRSPEIAERLNALVEEADQQLLRDQKRKKLYGATIDRKLVELDYLEIREFSFPGRTRQTYLPTTKGEAAGIVLGTRTSQGGVEYPTVYFSAAAASWVATLFVREVTE